MQVRTVNLGGITGELWQPKPTEQLIVCCHGYKSSAANPTIVAMKDLLNQKGHTVFTFSFSPSKGDVDAEQQVRDILSVVDHFEAYREIVLLAVSFAAMSATIATIQSPRVVGLITMSGFFGTGELGHEHRRKYVAFRVLALVHPYYRNILRHIRRELQPGRITVPVLVIHSQADRYVSIRQSERFFKALRARKQFLRLKTASHGVTADKDRRAVVEAIHTWLQTIR